MRASCEVVERDRSGLLLQPVGLCCRHRSAKFPLGLRDCSFTGPSHQTAPAVFGAEN